jgi:replicative DNA helicase
MTDDTTKSMPHALGVEKDVLSVVFHYPETADECPWLTADHFYIPAHKLFFEAVNNLRRDGKPVELVSFAQGLLESGLLDRMGGASAIMDVAGHALAPSHFAHHVSILSEHRARRKAIAGARIALETAMGGSAGDLAAECGKLASDVSDAITDSLPPKTTVSIIKESLDAFESRARGHDDGIGIPTIPEIDRCIRGLHPGRVYIFCAYPKGGKSVLASQIVVDTILDGIPAMFLTMEMTEREIMDRMIIQAARMQAEAFTSPKEFASRSGSDTTTNGSLRCVQNAAMRLAQSKLSVVRPANRNVATIAAAVRRAHRELGIKLAVIDFAQLLKSPGKTGVEEVEEISHTIQQLAQDLSIAIILPSQLNADGDTKNGRVFEEDAAAVINIVQDRNKESETYNQHRHMLVVADRFYGAGGQRIPLILDRERIRFIPGADQTSTKSKPQFKR